MALYFITGNAGKFKEVQAVIPEVEQLVLEVDEVQSLDPHVVIKHKLEQAAAQHEGAFIVDDASIAINSLHGLPGTMIKWFLESMGTDGLYELTTHYPDKSATVTVTLGFRDERGSVQYFAESYSGHVVAPRGENGFGFDPIFMAEGQTKTNAELTFAQKNAFSARGAAARKIAKYLAETAQS